ncbi:hypothetical protein G6F43_009958 [Rhizopus delemar]|nr:hypothetical protein G6F43_009958 [Rhizopus delemar]
MILFTVFTSHLDEYRTLHTLTAFDPSIIIPSTSETLTSYIRFIPLILASFVSIISASISLYLLPNNTKNLVQQRALLWINSSLCLFNIILISISYGLTLQTYSTKTNNMCAYLKNYDYTCKVNASKVETILIGISLGLFLLGIICSFICCYNLKVKMAKLTIENNRVSFYSDQGTRTVINEVQPVQSNTEKLNDYHIMPPSVLDQDTIWNSELQKERISLRPPPPAPPTTHHRPIHNNSNLTNSNTASSFVIQPFYESASSLSINEEILLPPSLPFANNPKRPLSHGSDNTFGAANRSSTMLADDSASHSSSLTDPNARRGSGNTLLYGSGSSAQSNHTLGTFNLNKASNHCESIDYSSDEAHNTVSEGGQQQIPETMLNHNLHQRINDYLHNTKAN